MLVFGGSFDPPHRWHVKVASAVRRKLCREGWVLFVPAARSPFKNRSPAASPEDRVRMLELATRRMGRARVWTDEIDRDRRGGGPSYMIDTIDRLRAVTGPGSLFMLLIGADQFVRLHQWKDWADVVVKAPPAVVLRRPITSKAKLRRLLNRTAWEGMLREAADFVIPAPMDPMSSTDIRRLISTMQKAGRAPAELRRMLDPAVLRYIREHGLYRSSGRTG